MHADAIRYQRPEIVLLHKEHAAPRKDERDLRTAWPVLDAAARRWLVEQVDRLYTPHPWSALVEEL